MAAVAVVGWVTFGRGFGVADGSLTLLLGGSSATLAVGATVYRRLSDRQ